jgi:hypothetical protein
VPCRRWQACPLPAGGGGLEDDVAHLHFLAQAFQQLPGFVLLPPGEGVEAAGVGQQFLLAGQGQFDGGGQPAQAHGRGGGPVDGLAQGIGEGMGGAGGFEEGQGHPALDGQVLGQLRVGVAGGVLFGLFHVAPQQFGDTPAARALVVPVAGAQQGQTVPAHLRVDAVIAAAEGGGEGREEEVGFEAVVGAGLEVDPDEVQQLGAQGFRQAGVDQQEQGVAAVVGANCARAV